MAHDLEDEPSMKADEQRQFNGYTLRGHRGRILYVGITSDPFRRVTDHTSSGKEFKTLTVETPPMGRREAEKW